MRYGSVPYTLRQRREHSSIVYPTVGGSVGYTPAVGSMGSWHGFKRLLLVEAESQFREKMAKVFEASSILAYKPVV